MQNRLLTTIAMSLAVPLLSLAPSGVLGEWSGGGTAASAATVTHIDVNQGEILNCFGWTYNAIKAAIEDGTITNAKFTGIQVSSVQPLPEAGCFVKDGAQLQFNIPQYPSKGVLRDIPDWYRVCAPLDIRMIAATDAAANTPLGTREEFDQLVETAHSNGLGVIVGVEANQVYWDTGKTASDLQSYVREAYDDAHWTDSDPAAKWDTGSGNPFNDPTRKAFTQYTINPGVLDLKTEEKTVYNKVVKMVGDLWDAGVDGIYWYHAKYIGLKCGLGYANSSYGMEGNTAYGTNATLSDYGEGYALEGSDFWPTVWKAVSGKSYTSGGTTVTMFNYGNVNLDPFFKGEKFAPNSGDIDHDPNYFANQINDDQRYLRPLREYTKYMKVVDAWYAKSAVLQDGVSFATGYWDQWQSSFKYDKDFNSDYFSGFYAAEATDLVLAPENEDTYFNNPEVMYEPMTSGNVHHENRPTAGISSGAINRAYASFAGQNGPTVVYFARPLTDDFTLGGNPQQADVTHQYVYYEDTNDWTSGETLAAGDTPTNLKLYNWGGSGKIFGSWPGTTGYTLKYVGTNNGHNVFSVIITASGTPQNLIFNNNNNGSQTGDLTFVNGGYYTATGRLPEDAVATPEIPQTDYSKMIRVMVKVPSSQNPPYIHVWGTKDNEQNTTWPGSQLGQSFQDGDYYWYVKYLPKDEGLSFIIHNNSVDASKIEKDNVTGDVAMSYVLDSDDKATSEDVTAATIPSDIKSDSLTIAIRMTDGSTDAPYVYPSKGGDFTGGWAWPGRQCTKSVTASDGSTWWYISVPRNWWKGGNWDTKVKVSKGKDANASGESAQLYADAFFTWDGGSGTSLAAITPGAEPVPEAYKVQPTGTTETLNYTIPSVIADVNLFHHNLRGESSSKEAQYNRDGTQCNIAAITRNEGAIVVMRTNDSGSHAAEHNILNVNENVTAGTYTDKVSGNTFTVDRSSMHGKIDTNSGIAVFYTDDVLSKAYTIAPSNNPNNTTMTPSLSDNSKITITPLNGKTVKYEVANNDYFYNGSKSWRYQSYVCKSGSTASAVEVPITNDTYNTFTTTDGEKPQKTTIYVRVTADGVSHVYTYILRNDQSDKKDNVTAHLLYFHVPETNFAADSLSIYAWDDEGDMAVPLVRVGGDRLGQQDANGNFTRPITSIYSASTDASYVNYVGSNSSYQTTYTPEKSATQSAPGYNWNDYQEIGNGKRLYRYTIGIPGIDFQTVKFRLTYHNPYGNSQQLDVMTLDDDAYYDIGRFSNGDLAIGKLYAIAGDAIYDNSSWSYTTPTKDQTSSPSSSIKNTFWEGDGGNSRNSTFLTFDPDASRKASVGGKTVGVYKYTGQFIQDKTFRFGYPFDFQENYIENPDSVDTNTQYHVALKMVSSTFRQLLSSYSGNGGSSSVSMIRGAFSKSLTSHATSDRTDASTGNLKWTLPSGLYTVALYEVQEADKKNYYYEVQRPYVSYNDNGTDKTDYMIPGTHTYDKDGESTTQTYWYADLGHVGTVEYQGTTAQVETGAEGNTLFRPDLMTMDGTDAKSVKYASNFPETGRYRMIYIPGHGNNPFSPTTETAEQWKTSDGEYAGRDVFIDGKDDATIADYMLGMRLYWYDYAKTAAVAWNGNQDGLTGYWGTYADGLDRVKPDGLDAYYVSGYKRENGTVTTLLLTKLKGDILPANTGLVFHMAADKISDAMFFDQTHIVSDTDPSDNQYGYIYMPLPGTKLPLTAAAADNNTALWQQEGTNFLVPWMAQDPSVTTHSEDTEWKEMPKVKRPDSQYDNYYFTYFKPVSKPNKVYNFYRIGWFRKNMELRKAFVSIPVNGTQLPDDGGGVVFGAKGTVNRTPSSDVTVQIVQTAPIDLVFGDSTGIATGITDVRTDRGDDGNAPYYDLSGRRVSKPARGVYIHNGRKIIVK